MAKKIGDIAPKGEAKNPVSQREVSIAPPNFQTAVFKVRGTAPLVQHAFGAKTAKQMLEKQIAGGTTKKGGKRDAKVPEDCFNNARHISTKGWDGLPAAAIRKAMIGACRLVNYKMTLAKIGFFVEHDGFDQGDGTPLVKIIGDKPKMLQSYVRVSNGQPDIRFRPQWIEWGLELRIKFDADLFTLSDIANLLSRAGQQCGIGEGRPSSESGGMDWGLFEIVGTK
jgi:hypothetical protein